MNDPKEKQTIVIMGVTLPRWQDCNRCKAKLACKFEKFAYDQPCEKCKQSKEYLEEQKNRETGWKHGNPLKNREITGVFQGLGTTFYTNHKGDVVKTESIRPLPAGDRNWKRPH
jgi:hypothetical protein